ncbi:hypothetical protein KAR91_57515, partial [Candidatus Pacearchaeota archaeon]|nr:hypothetical protein [Candidatus Pacearchaeota archaeon]
IMKETTKISLRNYAISDQTKNETTEEIEDESMEEIKKDEPLACPGERGVINRFIYHYCAQYQDVVGATSFIDGIAQLEERITCMDDYRKIKPLIDSKHKDKLTILSLSFIGMEKVL